MGQTFYYYDAIYRAAWYYVFQLISLLRARYRSNSKKKQKKKKKKKKQKKGMFTVRGTFKVLKGRKFEA
jgi:UDP-2,3-diacylglucosamine pyrophosphatase LpxH